jgi:hypothetical protein
VIISVGALLDRIAAQPDQVRALLAKRKVTPELLAQARALVRWSAIAHISTTDRRALRAMGFLRSDGTVADGEPLDDGAEEPSDGGEEPAATEPAAPTA